MRILATLDEPDYGDAFVDGFSVVDDPDRVRQRLGFMPDYYGAYPDCNCVEYLDFFARSNGLKGGERRDALNRVLEFTHMQHMAEKPTTGLSKGMKQRLCLGRTLIHDPSVLILDEPAAGLDPRARIELKEMIRGLSEAGKTLLISSHILSELAEMCDRVLIIEHGNLIAAGSIDDILSRFTGEGEHDSATQTVRLTVDVLDGVCELSEWFKGHGIEIVSQVRNAFEILVEDDRAVQADLLKRLIDARYSIVRFSAKQRTLEEAFLKATKGRIQ
ncbi:MAG: ABC transporter ATP-binding protein [Pirellulaceae bacterium]